MNRLEFLEQVPLLAGLTSAEAEALAKDMVRRQFRQGQAIFQQGDAGQTYTSSAATASVSTCAARHSWRSTL